MKKELICIACPLGCHIEVDTENNFAVTGNGCPKGITYGQKELTNPTRIVTSTVILKNSKKVRIPVKTDGEIPKELVFNVMELLENFIVSAPIKIGDILIENIFNTGVNIVATRTII